MGPYPSVQICEDRFAGFMEGVKSVAPDAEVVFNGGATNQEQARSKMTDFITRSIDFNIFAGCGSNEADGGFAAINAAGSRAVRRKGAGPRLHGRRSRSAGLEYLWSKDSGVMRAGMFGPKSAAESDVKMILDLLTGKVAYNQAVDGAVTMVWFGPNCAANRPQALDQFQGVEGFSVPDCTFDYSGND